jgi:hypothetical protein
LSGARSRLVKAYWCEDTHDACAEGTFWGILDKINRWGNNFHEPPVHWLTGPSGMGKSTIAWTIQEKKTCPLGAYFFYSESEKNCNPDYIIPALAYQLALKFPAFRSQYLELIDVFHLDHSCPHRSVLHPRGQMEHLLVKPLKDTDIQTMIMIDGLDKCQDGGKSFLAALEKFLPEIPQVKFLITASPQPQIQEGFLSRSRNRLTMTDLAKEGNEVNESIRKFFAMKLEAIWKAFPMEPDWPTEEELDRLCGFAEGQFSRAKILVEFMVNWNYGPRNRLDIILTNDERRNSLFIKK